jgi:hypothetical protein
LPVDGDRVVFFRCHEADVSQTVVGGQGPIRGLISQSVLISRKPLL